MFCFATTWLLRFCFIAGFVHNDSCPLKEKQTHDKLKMDRAFLNISTNLRQPIEISGISSNCYKVGEKRKTDISDILLSNSPTYQ